MVSDACFEGNLLFEHAFWLQVLGDHGRIIFTTLASSEKEKVQQAKQFIETFDQLLCQSQKCLSGRALMELTACAREAAKEIRCFKLYIIKQHLCEKIEIGLPPTFLNHMVNEVEEYLRILDCVCAANTIPAYHPVHHHILWLLDAVGHASAIAGDLDETEYELREKSEMFAKTFQDFYTKAVEYKGYLRTGVKEFPALDRFNCQVEKKILLFKKFLATVRHLVCENKALGAFTALVPDHMMREECYYLTKLADVSNISAPNCDPTRPRVEECGC